MILNFSNSKILVVGDLMLDKYYYGNVNRISPEAPVPIVNVKTEACTLGGAGNVANNLANLGCSVFLIGCTGRDQNAQLLQKILQEKGIDFYLLERASVPTIAKLRVLGEKQQMLRIDFEEKLNLNLTEENIIRNEIIPKIKTVDLVILSDYDKGIFSPNLTQIIINECKLRNVKVIVDPKGKNWNKYNGANIVTPNFKEFSEIINLVIPENDDEKIKSYGFDLMKNNDIETLLITRSERGMTLLHDKNSINIPTIAKEVYDVSGAGDTVIATLGAALASNYDLVTSVKLANIAAGLVVGKLGTSPVNLLELQGNFKI